MFSMCAVTFVRCALMLGHIRLLNMRCVMSMFSVGTVILMGTVIVTLRHCRLSMFIVGTVIVASRHCGMIVMLVLVVVRWYIVVVSRCVHVTPPRLLYCSYLLTS